MLQNNDADTYLVKGPHPIENVKDSSGADHFVVLDGLRGIAAILVGALHANQMLFSSISFFHTTLAVDFFFCLSGFVISFAYDRRLLRGMSLSEFSSKRLLRLYPMIILGSLIGGAVFALGSMREGGSLAFAALFTITSLVLLPGGFIAGREGYPVNNPIWSLFFELAANLIYAAVMPIRTAIVFAASGVSALALIAIAHWDNGVEFFGFVDPLHFSGGFVRVAFPFCAGILICRFRNRLFINIHPIVPIIALFIILLSPASSSWYYDCFSIIIAFPVIVWISTQSNPSVLRGPLIILGELSYPFYLVHQPILRALKHINLFMHYTTHYPAASVTVTMIIIAIASYVTFRVYDQPVREALGNRFFPKRVG